MEKNPFDDLAGKYDSEFTMSLIGIAQRKIVWSYLQRRIFPMMEILEINCGTGVDAVHLAGLDCRVTATDASDGMIRKCLEKNQTVPVSNIPDFIHASINKLDTVIYGRKFDLIFSNFSGLNCISQEEMRVAAAKFNLYLKKDGKLIFVVFGTKCLWEKLYFLLKGRLREMNRRKAKKSAPVQSENTGIKIYYYSPGEIKKLFGNFFKVDDIRPVGLFIPPTYLNRFFMHRKIFLNILIFIEGLVGHFSFMSDRADHYIIEFSKL